MSDFDGLRARLQGQHSALAALDRIEAKLERLRVQIETIIAECESYADEIAGTDEEGLSRNVAAKLRAALAEEKE